MRAPESPERMRLLQRFLESFRFECDGRVCVGFLTEDVHAFEGPASHVVPPCIGVAQIFGQRTSIHPEDARIFQVSPLVANPPERPVAINGGRYDADATVLGLGVAYSP